MNFKTYLAESEKTYRYRIKSLADIRESVGVIEKFLQRYIVVAVSKPTKSIIQKRPLDFPSVLNREVYMMDVELGLPVSAYVLERELVGMLGLPGDYIVVRTENDPMEIQTDAATQLADIEKQADKKGLTPAPLLNSDSAYPEAEQKVDGSNYYGDSYNSRLMGYLKDLSDERKEKQTVPTKSLLFTWLGTNSAEDMGDFNADHKPEVKPADKDTVHVAKTGNFEDDGHVVKKTYLNKNGEPQTLKGKPYSLSKSRKEK